VVQPDFFRVWRSLDAAGALISSARDQLRYVRFHLGDGTAPGGARLLTRQSLLGMRSNPGPGGTLGFDLDGVGVTWQLRPSAEGVRIVQHGGDWAGQHSGLLMVPDRGFAMTLLTNSDGGAGLVTELFLDDWALRRFAGISNPPAVPLELTPEELAPYEGTYRQQSIGPTGAVETTEFDIITVDRRLVVTVVGEPFARLAFYRPDRVILEGPNGEPGMLRADFVCGAGGRVDWARASGRLARHETTTASAPPESTTPRSTTPRPSTPRSSTPGRPNDPFHSRPDAPRPDRRTSTVNPGRP
jgi:Beta-lactamase